MKEYLEWTPWLIILGLALIGASYRFKHTGGPDSFAYHFLREVGIATIIAIMGVLLLDSKMAALHRSDVEEVKTMFANQRLPDMLQGALRSKACSDEIQTQLLDPDFLYREFLAELDLDLATDSTGEYLTGMATSTVKVLNRTQSPAKYVMKFIATDLTAQRGATFQSARIRKCDTNGRPHDSNHQTLDSMQIARLTSSSGSTGKSFAKTIIIDPASTIEITYVNRVSFDVTDEYVLRTRYICDRMEVQVALPSGFRVIASANHPGEANPDIFTIKSTQKVYRAAMNRPCLPYQGIRLSWAPVQ